MKVTTSTVTKLEITGLSDMDAISVMIEDFGPGAGEITITCAGEAWTHYWGHMGKHHTMRSFFLKCSTPYLIGKLKTGIERRIGSKDDELLQQTLRKHILEGRREGRIKPDEARELWDEAEYASFDGEYQELCQLVFGPEWWFNLPKEDNPEYTYLGKIVDTVKAAFSLEELQQKKAAQPPSTVATIEP